MDDYKRIIGMTGGMGAGKSTLVEVIKAAGIPVFDFDATVHALYEDSKILDHVGGLVGIRERGLTRKDISDEIVRRPYLLSVVEQFMMIHLNEAFKKRLEEGFEPFLVIDAPMLFEMGWDKHCDMIIAIQCPREIREERVMLRPGMTREKMTMLMDKQMSEADRLLRGHYIIHNDNGIEEAKAKMAKIVEHLKDFYA